MKLVKPFSFIFAGSSDFSLDCLKFLIKNPQLKLKAIISQPDRLKGRGLKKQSSAVAGFALSKNIPLFRPKTSQSPDFLNKIQEQNCVFSFVCAYGQILPLHYLKLFPKGSLNLHLSLLPRWRGAAPVQRALMAGDQETGVCLQVMAEKLDAGDIIADRKITIKEEDNAKTLFEKSLKEAEILLNEKLIPYLEGRIQSRPQDSSQAVYAHKIDKKSSKIEWTKSVAEIHNKIRALVLGPQAFCFLEFRQPIQIPYLRLTLGPVNLGCSLRTLILILGTLILILRPINLLGFMLATLLAILIYCLYSSIRRQQKQEATRWRLKIYRSQISDQTDTTGFHPGEICRLEKNRLSVVCGKGALDLLEVQKAGKKRQGIEEFLIGQRLKLKDVFL